MKRTPLKQSTNQLAKGTGLKKSSTKLKARKKTEAEIQEKKEQRERDWEFYQSIWEERKHQCEVCDERLVGEPLTVYFDHIIEKSQRNDLRYEKDNIALVCWNCHSNKTNGNIWPKYQEIINKTKEKYNI